MAEEKAKASSAHDDTVPAALPGEMPADSPALVEAPPPAQRYKLGSELGRGGMGRVVEAVDLHLGRTVAFKEVLAGGSTNMVRRFQREVRITARLEHASIVPLYDAGLMPDGRPFYVMRRVSGRPLIELIERARGLEERLALLPNVLAAIDAIAHAHRRGVIHRDLKPANILVGDLGETVVIDWGLAKVIDDDEPDLESFEPRLPSDSLQTQAGAVFGTPGFMSPEQARGDDPGPHSDVFALGATLYQLIAGKPPVRGTSATEVIASTVRLRIVPLATTAPGAPAELVTIIEKALAPDAEERYANAGELAEDVRRFLTGQLVAAHRYTRRQRIVRFAKRHRAALSIAALAMSAVAALSWFSVHRIMKERDLANAASQEAEQQRAIAAGQAKQARDRADQLLVSHARSRLEASPLAAIAALEHVNNPQPPLADEIDALVKAAMMRGIAWGLPTLPDLVTSFEMTRDGKRLLELDRFGRLQLLDLEARKAVQQHEIKGAWGATWVERDTKIFMMRSKQPPALFDPATQTVDHIATPMTAYAKTADGTQLAYIDDTGVGIFDIAARKATPLWKGKATDAIAIAPDGSWVAFAEASKRWRVIDRSGRVLLQQAGDVSTFEVSRGGKLAALRFGQVMETTPSAAPPVVVTLPIAPADAKFIHAAQYRGDTLVMFGDRALLTWNGTRVFRSASFENNVMFGSEAKDGMIAAVGSDAHVHVVRDDLHLTLTVTDQPTGMLRVATSPESSRIAATAKDAVLVWDVAGLFPARIDQMPGTFIARDRIVFSKGLASDIVVYDVQRKTTEPLTPKIEGMPGGWEVAEDGRFLIMLMTPQGHQALIVYPDLKKQVAIADMTDRSIALVEGDALIYNAKGRVFGKVGLEEARELVTLQGDTQSIAPNGPLGYAALSTTGELVRGTFGGGNFARTQLKDLGPDSFITCDPGRNVLVASGNRLLRWTTSVDEVSRFTEKIASVNATETGIYISLANRDLYFVALRGDQTPRRVPTANAFSIVDRGKRVVGLSPTMQVEIVDMPSFAKWTLPKLYAGRSALSVSRDGQRVLHGYGGASMLWTLPKAVPPLDQLTNAVDDDGAIVWPWEP